jgi:hypothetical protein
LLTSADGDGVGLTVVLGHVGVDELDNVGTDGGVEDSGEWRGAGLFSGEGEDGENGAGSHVAKYLRSSDAGRSRVLSKAGDEKERDG